MRPSSSSCALLVLRLACAVVCLCGVFTAPAHAQTASDYFHDAAQSYIAEDLSAAREAVERGLALAPDDSRLLALQEKLNQSGPSPQPDSAEGEGGRSPQSGDEGESTSGSQGSPDDPGGDQPSDRSDPSGTGTPPPDANRQDGQQNDAQRASGSPGADGEAGQQARPDGTRRGSERMSRAQAERILQALEGQELQLLREVQTSSGRPVEVEKDW